MRYDFSKMDADSFELMVRSLNEKIFGVKCEQFGLGPDGQREFTFEGMVKDCAGVEFQGRTIGQVKYRYVTTTKDDYKWLTKEIDGELERFRKKEKGYRPDNYLFYTNLVLTPTKDTGTKDKINAYVKDHNDIIPNFYVKGYDEICALLDNNRDVATSYAAHILPGDVLMQMLTGDETDNLQVMKKYLFAEFEEEMYTRLDQAGSVTEKKISIERVCVDIDVTDKEGGKTCKFARQIFDLGNKVLGHKKTLGRKELERDENFVLIGGPGNGKSTICQFIAQIYRACYLKKLKYTNQVLDEFLKGIEENYQYQINCARIPFKIVLREYAAWVNRKGEDESISVMDYMQDRIRKKTSHAVPLSMLRKLLGMQAWIFFFDGLDEVPESSNRQEVLRQLRFFVTMELQEMQCDCMVIATTRAQGYNHDFDVMKYKHVEVAEFSQEDCKIYIKRLFEVMEEQTERREECIRIMEEAMKDETISRLMKTPLQASIISILVKSGGKPPHERYSLFRQYYDTMIRRERQKEIVATLNDNMDWLEEIHYMVGYRLQCESEGEENPSAEISGEKLKALIGSYVEEKKDDYYESEHGTEEKEKEFFMTITRRICFLCENREGFYSFSIRSIQEYFAGTYLVKDRGDEEAMENIRRIAYSSYWRNVLLFALGYIELERKCLEKEIGLLCQQMNGTDNIEKADYSSENICLFGSWLAVDILAEDIFRGREQNKYVKLAAEASVLTGCTDFDRFRQISGAQKDKLLRYVKENCCRDEKGMAKVFELYYELNRNKKNDMTQEIIQALEKSTEEQKIEVCSYILANSTAFRGMVIETARRQIEDALEKGKIKKFLPENAIEMLMYYDQKIESKELRKHLFLQCLYGRRKINRGVMKRQLGICCEEIVYKYLTPQYRLMAKNEIRIKLTKSIDIFLMNKTIDKNELKEIRKELQNLNIKYLIDFCDFLILPSFEKYQKLCVQLNLEDEYLTKAYKDVLQFYVPKEKISSEEEFQKMELGMREDYKRFIKGECLQKIYLGETDEKFRISVKYNSDFVEELVEESSLSYETCIGRLNDIFFKLCIWEIGRYWEFKSNEIFLNDIDAVHLLMSIREEERRNVYNYNLIYMVEVLIASKYKKQFWEQHPDFLFVAQMMEQGMFGRRMGKQGSPSRIRRILNISLEGLENVIGDIVHKVLYDEKENNYLSIIPFFIEREIDIRKCISETDIRKLEQMEYKVEANLLAMKLLRMCMYGNEMPDKVLEDILSCNVPRKTLYEELENMLYYCKVENREKLLVGLYMKLEDEDFKGGLEIRNRILNFMLEKKCSRSLG